MIAEKIYNDFQETKIPFLNLPKRTKANITFDEKFNVWKYGKNSTERNAKSLDGAYMILRTMYMADFIKDGIEQVLNYIEQQLGPLEKVPIEELVTATGVDYRPT